MILHPPPTGRLFFSSDHHFNHKNVIAYCDRPFKSVFVMDIEMIIRWNELVQPEDTVIYLGDFSLSTGPLAEIAPNLHGRKILIPGNHDQCHPWGGKQKMARHFQKYLVAGFELLNPDDEHYLNLGDGQMVRLSHFPYREQEPGEHGQKHAEHRPVDNGSWLFHGHVHQHWLKRGRMINVGVDVHDFRPVALEHLVALMKEDT